MVDAATAGRRLRWDRGGVRCLLSTLDVLTTHKASVQETLQNANATAQELLNDIVAM